MEQMRLLLISMFIIICHGLQPMVRPWGACSKSCGGGVQFREVICPVPIPRPRRLLTSCGIATQQSCNNQPCPPECFSIDTELVVGIDGKHEKMAVKDIKTPIANILVARHSNFGEEYFTIEPALIVLLEGKSPGIEVTTESGLSLKGTENHFVHAGERLGEYSSLFTLRDLNASFANGEDVFLWRKSDQVRKKDKVVSMKKVMIDGLADVVPLNSLEPRHGENGENCDYITQSSIIANDLIISHASDIWEGTDSEDVPKEEKLLLWDVFIDTAMKDLNGVDFSLMDPRLMANVGADHVRKVSSCVFKNDCSAGLQAVVVDEVREVFEQIKSGSCDDIKPSPALHAALVGLLVTGSTNQFFTMVFNWLRSSVIFWFLIIMACTCTSVALRKRNANSSIQVNQEDVEEGTADGSHGTHTNNLQAPYVDIDEMKSLGSQSSFNTSALSSLWDLDSQLADDVRRYSTV